MGNTRREFTPEYKDEAVKLVITTGRPVSTVPRELRVKEATLGGWVNLFRASEDAGEGWITESWKAELLRLRKENADLKLNRAFQKKSGSDSSSGQPPRSCWRWRYSGVTNSADTVSGRLERKYPDEMQLSDRCWKAWAFRKPFPCGHPCLVEKCSLGHSRDNAQVRPVAVRLAGVQSVR